MDHGVETIKTTDYLSMAVWL